MKGGEQMEQLYLGQRAMVMPRAIRRLLERVGVYDGRPILDMDVREKGHPAVIRYEQQGQQPFQTSMYGSFHAGHLLYEPRKYD